MTMLAGDRAAAGRPVEGRLTLGILALLVPAAAALAFVASALWPRWPEPPVAADAPALPVVVGGVSFKVPPGAIRVAIQRRPGAQERIDLVFLWPSLAPPPPDAAPLSTRDRVFVSIASADSLPPVERLRTIYPRYIAIDPPPGPPGLALFAFRDGTPYQGEDLAYDPAAPDRFLARCSRATTPLAPGTCLETQRLGAADVTVRFPREWLENWRDVEAGLERLIRQLRGS
ncbi:MAG TPA: hypothetical protein VFU97_26630 [Xanthobacteraceae bacterium]|nr:hypothetical protein [Xanthobacteraceae bacterium]